MHIVCHGSGNEIFERLCDLLIVFKGDVIGDYVNLV